MNKSAYMLLHRIAVYRVGSRLVDGITVDRSAIRLDVYIAMALFTGKPVPRSPRDLKPLSNFDDFVVCCELAAQAALAVSYAKANPTLMGIDAAQAELDDALVKLEQCIADG